MSLAPIEQMSFYLQSFFSSQTSNCLQGTLKELR